MSVPATDPLYGEAADVSALRVFRDYGDQSRAGFMHTELELGDYCNKVSAADTYLRLNENWLTELLMVNTETGRGRHADDGPADELALQPQRPRASTRTTTGPSRAAISTCRSAS